MYYRDQETGLYVLEDNKSGKAGKDEHYLQLGLYTTLLRYNGFVVEDARIVKVDHNFITPHEFMGRGLEQAVRMGMYLVELYNWKFRNKGRGHL